MALCVEPVFLNPLSIVIYPVFALRADISMAFSFSVPSITGNSYTFPSNSNFAISDIFLSLFF